MNKWLNVCLCVLIGCGCTLIRNYGIGNWLTPLGGNRYNKQSITSTSYWKGIRETDVALHQRP